VRLSPLLAACALVACAPTIDYETAAAPGALDWSAIETETLEHFQTLLRTDTRDPPGGERPAAEYITKTLRAEGIDVQIFSLEPHRPNVIARIKGNGSKRPLLVMAHMDVVNVDTTKWRFPPFSATRDSGYVYGRGAVDDKDNLASALMLMLMIKRQQVPLDRDVIFLAEAGEEGSTRVGIQFMANQHFDAIDAEYCIAEGGGVSRSGGEARFAAVSTTEKIPRAITLTARGTAGHGSVPLRSNAVAHLAAAIAKFDGWRPPIQFNATTREYFTRLATISAPDRAARYLDVISGYPRRANAADEHFLDNEPAHASMLRTSISPTIVQAGYRVNVIPSEAVGTLDVRMFPGEDTTAFLETIKQVVNDPAVEVTWARRDVRPGTPPADLNSEAFKAIEAATHTHYNTITLPTMLNGATDMAYLRAKGMECYGVGPAIDSEDAQKGFGAHSDQERILEAELHRFVRFQWDVVMALAKSGQAPAASH
jgi:acetylornithine deacetylase/succinyl-diaminopimelate desuccinylase-like protein